MKKIFSVLINRNRLIKITICVLFAAASQPLVAWSISGLSSIITNQELFYYIAIKNLLILTFAIIIAWLSDNIKSNLLLEGELELRKHIFTGIYAMPIGDFKKKDSGSYYNQVGRDVQLISSNVLGSLLRVIVDILSISFIAALLMYCHWLSFLVISFFLLPLIINNTLMPKKIEKCQENSMHMLVKMTIKVKDVLSGFFVARFQEGEEYIKQSTFECFEKSTIIEKGIAKLSNLSALIANASVTLSQFSGLSIAFLLLQKRQIDFTQFILIFQLGMILNSPVVDLINSIITIRSFKPYINGAEQALSVHADKACYKLDKIDNVSFRNVSFCYPEKQRYILQQFNHCFERGKKYLIIGESGSGKTTLIKLLLGILSPTSGSINYNTVKQQELSPAEIYHHSAVVPQQIYIFDDTIRRNLDLQGNCSDQQLLDIIRKVKLDKFFAINQYTLDSHISNETLQVSGGEKARIGLARTLVMYKSIVIYDEVLSGLDPQNADLVEDLILTSCDQIVIHIAHNSSPKYLNRYDEVIRLNM